MKSSKVSQPWIPLDRIEQLVQFEPALVVLGLTFVGWVVHRFFSKHLSEDRQRGLRELFRNLSVHLSFGLISFIVFIFLDRIPHESALIGRVETYFGFAAILFGSTVFVKISRILVFEYLYLSHMKVSFPVLLVNLFTLLLSLLLAGWIGTEVFNVQLTPILATSAIFSLVLGLALQDTLGNLFAGVALQFDKPFGIGDWIEIQHAGQAWVGQVHEISWRATVLVSFTKEFLTVPNRVMGQAQISNYSHRHRPVIRSLTFRLAFGVDVQRVKDLLFDVAKQIPEIRKIPKPVVLVAETSESWISFKLVYYIDYFGSQYVIADQVYTQALSRLESEGFRLPGHRVVVSEESEAIPPQAASS